VLDFFTDIDFFDVSVSLYVTLTLFIMFQCLHFTNFQDSLFYKCHIYQRQNAFPIQHLSHGCKTFLKWRKFTYFSINKFSFICIKFLQSRFRCICFIQKKFWHGQNEFFYYCKDYWQFSVLTLQFLEFFDSFC
jgi:hypothetical protein